jgi:hypothetical protein
VLPMSQCCTLPAHEEATLPLSMLPSPWPWPLRLQSPSPSLSPSPTLLPSLALLLLPLPSLLPSAIAIAVAVAHCCCCLCRVAVRPLSSPLPLPSDIAVSVTIGHCSRHLCQPSLLPLLSAIDESCCLGVARIVFKQFKQRMLNLFYFVQTVGSALIKAGLLTRRQAVMANTSVGRQAANSKRLVGKVDGSRGAAGWRCCLTMGGVILLG